MVQRPPKLILNNTRRKLEEEEEEEEEESSSLLSGCKVVEYLGPVMSSELLFKFPDNSAFDFDYSQSSLWSPLVPRFHRPPDVEMALVTPTKLAFGLGCQGLAYETSNSNKKDKSKKKKKKKKKKTTTCVATSAFNLNLSVLKTKHRKKKNMAMPSEFSPTAVTNGGCAPFATKGWNKLLKAASKHFKRRKRRESTFHVKLSNYLT